MVLMSSRNYVRLDFRFWMFHDGDGRTRTSSWSNPSHNSSSDSETLHLLSLLLRQGWKPEGSRLQARFTTARSDAQTCQPIGRYVTFIITPRHILTTYHQNRHQWGERGRGGLAMVAMDKSHYMIVLMLASNRSMQRLLDLGSM